MATSAGVAPALPLPPSVREQAPYRAHDCFILGKNSHDQPVGNTREKRRKVCGIGAVRDDAGECANRRRSRFRHPRFDPRTGRPVRSNFIRSSGGVESISSTRCPPSVRRCNVLPPATTSIAPSHRQTHRCGAMLRATFLNAILSPSGKLTSARSIGNAYALHYLTDGTGGRESISKRISACPAALRRIAAAGTHMGAS